jgi:uncharacterized membrane protein
LLLTVVFIPFPTSLLGEHLLTNHSSPAVILYTAIIALQGLGWVLLSAAALKSGLAKNEKAIVQIKINRKNGYITFIVYSLLAIISFWFPFIIAIITTMTLLFWLFYGVKMKHE